MNQTSEMTDKISVIIPAYNAEKTISATVESVLKQTLPPYEVIVVNDGSKDRTQEIVEAMGERVILINQSNSGVSAARNNGLAHAEGEWVAFLDSDDVWHPTKLQKQADFLLEHADLHWCATRFYRCAVSEKSLSRDHAHPKSISHENRVIDAFDSLSGQTAVWIGTILVRKSLVEKVGAFCEELASPADNDLWIRVALEQPQLGFIGEPLADYMIYPESMSGQASRKIKPERFTFYRRLADLIENAPAKHREGCKKFYDRSVGIYLFNLARAGQVTQSRELMAWLKENRMRIPGWRYRWPMWLPTSLIGIFRSGWQKLKPGRRNSE